MTTSRNNNLFLQKCAYKFVKGLAKLAPFNQYFPLSGLRFQDDKEKIGPNNNTKNETTNVGIAWKLK